MNNHKTYHFELTHYKIAHMYTNYNYLYCIYIYFILCILSWLEFFKYVPPYNST